jgi:hypothetical protein
MAFGYAGKIGEGAFFRPSFFDFDSACPGLVCREKAKRRLTVWHSRIVHYRRKEILNRLQPSFGREMITRISFRVG